MPLLETFSLICENLRNLWTKLYRFPLRNLRINLRSTLLLGFFADDWFDFPDPDIAVAHGVAVVLQADGAFGCVRRVLGWLGIRSCPQNLRMVVHADTVVEDGDVCRLH